MFSYLVRPVRQAISSLAANNSPHHLALGFALGMVIGLMPKGNLIALSLCVLLFSMRTNTGIGLVAVVFFSCLTSWTDPIADKLGALVLTTDSMQASYATLFQLPLGPWVGFDNTVVTGALLVGLYLFYPVYWFAFVGIRYQQSLSATHARASQINVGSASPADHGTPEPSDGDPHGRRFA